MRLHRIHLQNYRGVTDCSVVFATDGVTIIEGDNEVGKTCIPEALDLILSAPDSSQARQVRDVKPVDRVEGAEVEIEVSSGDYRFVYSKRWHRQPWTKLEIAAPRHEQVTGREAHERVEQILAETLDESLWRALRIEQGAEVDLPQFNMRSLGRALDVAAGGGHGSGGDEDDLWGRIGVERSQYWTATGRVSAARQASANEVEKAESTLREFEARLEAIEADVAEVERLVTDEVRLVATLDDCERRESELRAQWDSTERLRERVESLGSDHRAAVAERDRVEGDHRRREDLRKEQAERTDELANLEAAVEQAAPVLAAVVRRSEEATAALEDARAARRTAEEQQRVAAADRDHEQRLIDVALLQARFDRVLAAQETLSAAEAHLESARVDDDLVGRIEEANLAVVRAEATAERAAAVVEVTALSDMTVQVDGIDEALGAGVGIERVVGDESVLVVPDVVEVRVRAGTDAKGLAAELAEARQELDRLCALGGVGDLAASRQAAEDRRATEQDRRQATTIIEENLQDLTAEALRGKIRGLSRGIEAYAAERPDEPPLPGSVRDAKRVAEEAERIVAEFREQQDTCDIAATDAAGARREAEIKEADLKGQIQNARTAVQDAERRLVAARQGRSDADLTGALAAAQQKAEAARGALEQAKEELQIADPDSLEVLLHNARAAAGRADDKTRSNRERQRELRISLELQGEEGLDAGRAEAESRYHHVQSSHERTESRAQAAQLLYETFSARRAESRRRYLTPFKDRIEQFGRIVFGPTFEIELDDDLRVVRRTLDGITLEVDQLSVGAREQVGVLSRLACAAIVSPGGGGAPVVLDDALGWSDPSRLVRMGAAIATAGRECQVIVLTCTPGRYAHVGNAKVVSLPG